MALGVENKSSSGGAALPRPPIKLPGTPNSERESVFWGLPREPKDLSTQQSLSPALSLSLSLWLPCLLHWCAQ